MSASLSRRTTAIRLFLPLSLFLAFCVLAVVHLVNKPGLPDGYSYKYGRSDVVEFNGFPVTSPDDLEFLLSDTRLGDPVLLGVRGPHGTVTRQVVVGRYHSTWMVLFDVMMVLVILTLGIVVRLYFSDEGVGTVFLLASCTLGMAVLATTTIHEMEPDWLGNILCSLFFLSYCVLPVLFLHFTAIFPVRRFRGLRLLLGGLYAAGAVIALWQASSYLAAARAESLELFHRFEPGKAWMNGFMMGGIAAGLVTMVDSYRKTLSLADRRKIAWILYGLVIGTAPFVLFWVLPQTIGLSPVIPEIVFKVFLLIIPVCFSIAILKYRFLDITIIINRSMFHATLLGALLVLYTALIMVTVEFITTWTFGSSVLLSAVVAIMAAVAYDPVRRWAQRMVDHSFFRVGYDFRGSLKQLLDDLKRSAGIGEMASRLVAGVDQLLPVERIGYFVLIRPGDRLTAISQRNFTGLEAHGVRFNVGRVSSTLDLPVALDDKIESAVRHESAEVAVFSRWKIALAFPMKSRKGELFGFLVLGEKKSGLGFSEEDVDLLAVLAGQASHEHERLTLEMNLRLEHAEAERLEELNRMKSFFVSSVSHDLKTPLTSIRMFAEILRSGADVGKDTANDYLRIIEGESDRLTRLINNVLDFAKIERGVKEYHLRETDLNAVVEKMAAIMEYQFRIEKAKVDISLSEEMLLVHGDPDAILEALLNIVANSLKYSPGRKEIRIRTFRGEGTARIVVRDNGTGIPENEQERIFAPFHRVGGAGEHAAGGTGLGLAVVKHVMDAHGGEIKLRSRVGEGTEITLCFREESSHTGKEAAR